MRQNENFPEKFIRTLRGFSFRNDGKILSSK